MEHEAPIGEKRRGFRHWRRLILGLPLLAILGFFLSNLLLATPWARGWIAARIETKTGLEANLSGISWSPWGGISLRGLEILQPAALRSAIPDPLIRIDTVKLSPVWKAWLRGRFDLRSISLDTPRVTLPLELLSHLSQAPAPPSTATPPPAIVSAADPEPTRAVPPSAPKPDPATESAPPTPAPPVPTLPPRPTGWVHLENASLTLVSVSLKGPLFEISDASGSLPIAGDPAQSELQIGTISFGGQPAISQLTAPLEWKYPILSLQPIELRAGDCKVELACKIASLSGLPVQLEARIPEQPLASLRLPFNGEVKAESITLNFGFRGLLLAPQSWQGDLVTETRAPSLRVAGHDAKFDRGGAVTVLRGGRLSCVDARLIGDGLSLLGNATLLADGRVAAALRIVAPPESLEGMVRNVFPAVESPTLTALGTPQRAAFDLEAFGNIRQLFVRVGKDGPVMNLNP